VSGRLDRPRDDDSRRDLELLYRSQAAGLARFFRARFRGTEDADDMVQEVFARMAGSKHLAEVRDPRAYLSRILRNFLIDRKRRESTSLALLPLEGVEPSAPPDQFHGIEVAEMRAQYRTAVDALPPRTRQVFLLHRSKEQSVKSIAGQLGISPRTVEWHLAQAILRIGEALERA
jgi:RNA polymerase sigma factor (sigma-70 family)